MQNKNDQPAVSVVVLNWNGWQDTAVCLDSIEGQSYSNLSIIVVDNGSNDGSSLRIRASHPSAEIVELASNVGYAGGNNSGIKYAVAKNPDYVMLLNNDTQVGPAALEHLVRAAESDPGAALLGPTVLDLEDPTRIQSAGTRLDYLWRSHQRNLGQLYHASVQTAESVDSVIGAALLVRASVLDELGMLDSDYFVYREDVDWCLRAKRLGYRVLYVPEALVWHKSHLHSSRDQTQITYYMTRNSLLLVQRQGGGILRLLALLARHVMTAVAWSIRPKWSHKRADRNALIRGIVDFLRRRTGMWDRHHGSQSTYGVSEAG